LLIPSKYARRKKNSSNAHDDNDHDISPPLTWSNLPNGTKSLVLVMDDPDAPDPRASKMTWVHWVVYDIPPTMTMLEEGISSSSSLSPDGIMQGLNDWKQVGYGGPSPPIGTHRYFFKLYALDIDHLLQPQQSSSTNTTTKATVVQAMQGGHHILGQAELMGTYQKQK
jgi:Raf kinase inhibitor-like YbhB/YbcL family protein